MSQLSTRSRLDRPVDTRRDHVLGPDAASLTLVEYGSYACPYCRAANEEITRLRDRFGTRLRYCFRQRPLTGSELAWRAAQVAESTPDDDTFWRVHIELMTRSPQLTEDDLAAVGSTYALTWDDPETRARAQARVEADVASAGRSGVHVTPTFFINERRYDGPWDEASLAEAMLGSLGHRVHSAALDFATWAPATAVLLLATTLLALALTNSPMGDRFTAIWEAPLGISLGEDGIRMPLAHWLNDGLLTLFFLVVGLEIKRELTVGRLASRRLAAFPIAAAAGGMVVPAAMFLALTPPGSWQAGWGVPMPTDTAFAVALIVMLGSRVPVELRVFLTAAAIVDDVGTIAVVALFYSGEIQWPYLLGALAVLGALALLNRWGVYRAMPYALLGVILWGAIHAAGLHATLGGVLLALFIPTRPPPNLQALLAQASAVVHAEVQDEPEVLRHGLSRPALQSLDAIHDRLESPADRLLRGVEPWSSFLVLPLFALANAGVVLSGEALAGREPMILATGLGLAIGKPAGILLGCALAVALGIAEKPAGYSWRQLAGAGALAGIGFTMSLFIAGQAYPVAGDFAAAKIAVFGASLLSALVGVSLLWWPRTEPTPQPAETDGPSTPM